MGFLIVLLAQLALPRSTAPYRPRMTTIRGNLTLMLSSGSGRIWMIGGLVAVQSHKNAAAFLKGLQHRWEHRAEFGGRFPQTPWAQHRDRLTTAKSNHPKPESPDEFRREPLPNTSSGPHPASFDLNSHSASAVPMLSSASPAHQAITSAANRCRSRRLPGRSWFANAHAKRAFQGASSGKPSCCRSSRQTARQS